MSLLQDREQDGFVSGLLFGFLFATIFYGLLFLLYTNSSARENQTLLSESCFKTDFYCVQEAYMDYLADHEKRSKK